MKKTILILVAILGLSFMAAAQPRALGVRAGYGGELSYQHGFGANFGEFDLGWCITTSISWVFMISSWVAMAM